MAEVLIGWPLTAEAPVRSHASACRMFGGQVFVTIFRLSPANTPYLYLY